MEGCISAIMQEQRKHRLVFVLGDANLCDRVGRRSDFATADSRYDIVWFDAAII
jgi:hypothetical protein